MEATPSQPATVRRTATITVAHPTKWGPQYNGLRDVTVAHELRPAENLSGQPMTGRYNVHVNDTRVGWVAAVGRTWKAYQLPRDGSAIGTRVATERSRSAACDELILSLRGVPGVVRDVIETAWEAAES